MSQHDMNIANQGFPAFREDLNDALPALASNNAGATEPIAMFAHQWWVDTSANPSVLKQRNTDNDAWITLATIDQTGGTFSIALAEGGTGASTAAQAKINLEVITAATGSSRLPTGTTGQRDGSPSTGFLRFNTTVSKPEVYNGTTWGSVGGGATGAGGDEVFVENGQEVTADYTITTNKNAMSAGPITVNSGVSVTVPTGSRWVIS